MNDQRKNADTPSSQREAVETPGPGADEGEAPRPVIDLIKRLQSGAITGSSLAMNDRQRVVEHLSAEGCSVAEIAAILGTSDRTIARDRKAIREANSVEANPQFTAEMVGTLVREADIAIARIRRIVRAANVPSSVKIDAERACWMITRELVQCLQRLGYLPTAAHEIRADLTHHVDDPLGYDQMLEEVTRLEVSVARGGKSQDGAMLEKLGQLKTVIVQNSVGACLTTLSQSIQEGQSNDQRS